MFMPASIRPLKSRARISCFSVSFKENLSMNASGSRLNASRSAGEHSAVHILFSRKPRRDRRRSKIEVSGMGFSPKRSAPNFFRSLDAKAKLGFFLLHRQVVAVVGAGEAALRR